VFVWYAKIINAGQDSFIIEITGNEQKIDALISILEPIGIKKLTRSGILTLKRELDETHFKTFSMK
jgi:acetolactate synthase-1/3 small subunit